MQNKDFQRPTQNPPIPIGGDDFNPAELPPSNAVAAPSGDPAPNDMAAVLEALRMQTVWLERIAVMIRATRDDREDRAMPVKIADLNMPFIHMVGLMVKATIAAIPAGIIAGIVIALVVFVCGGTSLLAVLAAALRR